MEADVYFYCRFETQKLRNLAYKFIHEDTRPVFADDVPAQQQAIFHAVEELNYPESLTKVGKLELVVHWFTSAPASEDELFCNLTALKSAGAESVSACVLIDGELEGTIKSVGDVCYDRIEGDESAFDDSFQALLGFLRSL